MNVLNTLKHVSEVCSIFCATANPVVRVVAQTELGRGILGVVEGAPAARVETVDDEADRKTLPRRIRYKL
jgi:adenosine/AMP kinase